MPVAQKTGPDGCLYVLDWYDRYHCYQDANRDPQGIDRLQGRLYRIRYKGTPPAGKFDLGKESDDQLDRSGSQSPNIYFRDTAQRLPRPSATRRRSRTKLQKLVLDDAAPRKARLHALWALIGGRPAGERSSNRCSCRIRMPRSGPGASGRGQRRPCGGRRCAARSPRWRPMPGPT